LKSRPQNRFTDFIHDPALLVKKLLEAAHELVLTYNSNDSTKTYDEGGNMLNLDISTDFMDITLQKQWIEFMEGKNL
jgi:hypothetical protein